MQLLKYDIFEQLNCNYKTSPIPANDAPKIICIALRNYIRRVKRHLIDLINHVTADDEENVCGDDADGRDCVSWLFVPFDDDRVPSDV